MLASMSGLSDSVKRVARLALARGAQAAGQLARAEARQHAGLTVLCYHRVLPEAARWAYHDPGLVVTPEAFAAHCQLMAERFTVLPLSEAVALWQRGERAEKPLAAITFDDGYQDNHVHAAPVLRQHGLRATFFIIAGLVGSRQLPWYDEAGRAWNTLAARGDAPAGQDCAFDAIAWAKLLPAQERLDWVAELSARAALSPAPEIDCIMTAAQLQSLVDAGHEIGSHSLTHPIVTRCNDGDLRMELEESRERLGELVHAPVLSFCYPNGDHDLRTLEALRRAGYTCAATMDPGVNLRSNAQALTLKRWFVQEDRLRWTGTIQSPLLMRTEWSGLAERLYRRGGAGASTP